MAFSILLQKLSKNPFQEQRQQVFNKKKQRIEVLEIAQEFVLARIWEKVNF